MVGGLCRNLSQLGVMKRPWPTLTGTGRSCPPPSPPGCTKPEPQRFNVAEAAAEAAATWWARASPLPGTLQQQQQQQQTSNFTDENGGGGADGSVWVGGRGSASTMNKSLYSMKSFKERSKSCYMFGNEHVM